jgi:hypothetical protein
MMLRTCTICSHPARDNIEAALIRRVPYRTIEDRFKVTHGPLSRHTNECLAEDVQRALSEYRAKNGVKVLSKLSAMIDRLDAFLDKAEGSNNALEFRAVAAEWRKQLELIAKLQGELAQEGTITIVNNPEWVELRTVIVQALLPHPEAREDVLRAIRTARGGDGHAA